MSREEDKPGLSSTATAMMQSEFVKDPEAVVKYVKEISGAAVNCKYCHVDISEKLRIRCAECVTPFDLCGDCFSSGVELYPHTNNHAYHVIDCLHKPIFTKDWTALEDLKLLNGIDTFGLGNWKLISDSIGSKSARACGEHYWDQYMGRFGRCLPATTLVQGDQVVSTESLLPAAASRLAPHLFQQKQRQRGEVEGGGGGGKMEVETSINVETNMGAHVNVDVDVDVDVEQELELTQELLAEQTRLVNLPPAAVSASLCSDVGSVVERFKGTQSRGRCRERQGGGGGYVCMYVYWSVVLSTLFNISSIIR